MKSKPRISNMTEKNMLVECPFCGQHNTTSKTKRSLTCKKCKVAIDLDLDYEVKKY